MRFRFAGIEYVATGFWLVEGYRKVRATIAVEATENAPDYDDLGERDPEGTSWTDLSLRWTREQTAELTRRLADLDFMRHVSGPAAYLERGAEIMRHIAADSAAAAGPRVGDQVYLTEAQARNYMRLTAAELGEPLRGRSELVMLNDDTPFAADKRRALTPEERLFMCRSAARIEAELVYLRNNSQTVCQVFQETKRASLGYTTALEMALICVARELEDARLSGLAPTGNPRPKPIHENPCPGCGINLSPVDAEPSLVRHSGRTYPSIEENATIYEGHCERCGKEVASVVAYGHRFIRVRAR